jgi:hypothetical protein
MIAYCYKPSLQHTANVRDFFKTLEFILPCKYCRQSFSEFMERMPIDSHLGSARSLAHWLFHIHNMVNEKLRKQNLLHERNPTFEHVTKHYMAYIKSLCTPMSMPGWDFLLSVAFNTPTAAQQQQQQQQQQKHLTATQQRQMNRDNTLPVIYRMEKLRQFWSLLPHVLPFAEMRSKWRNAAARIAPPMETALRNGGQEAMRWVYEIRRGVETAEDAERRLSFSAVCTTLSSYSSRCKSKEHKGVTCRSRTRRNSSVQPRRNSYAHRRNSFVRLNGMPQPRRNSYAPLRHSTARRNVGRVATSRFTSANVRRQQQYAASGIPRAPVGHRLGGGGGTRGGARTRTGTRSEKKKPAPLADLIPRELL